LKKSGAKNFKKIAQKPRDFWGLRMSKNIFTNYIPESRLRDSDKVFD